MSTRDLLQQAGFLEAVDFARLEQRIERLTVASGTVLVREGELGDAAYVIERGSAQVYVTTADGADVVTARLGAGAHFGEQALLRAHHRRNASVRAAEDSVVLRLPADTMNELVTGDASLRRRLDEIGRRQDQQRFARQSSLFKTMRLEDFMSAEIGARNFGDALARPGAGRAELRRPPFLWPSGHHPG